MAAAYLVLVERWMAAWIQMRRGPNRVGIPLTNIRLFGLGQPLADGLKFIFKEEYTPAHVNRRLYVLAPILILATALAVADANLRLFEAEVDLARARYGVGVAFLGLRAARGLDPLGKEPS